MFFNLWALRVAKSQHIPPEKFGFPGFEGHTELFGPHPLTWKTHPTKGYPDAKVWVCALLFLPEKEVAVNGEFPDLVVVLNLVVCDFYAEALFCAHLRPFASFRALLRTCVRALLRSFGAKVKSIAFRGS